MVTLTLEMEINFWFEYIQKSFLTSGGPNKEFVQQGEILVGFYITQRQLYVLFLLLPRPPAARGFGAGRESSWV